MKARYSLMADAANLSTDGKVNILGEFNIIYSIAFPISHSALCYVASIEVEFGDDNQAHELELRYVDADGNIVAPPIMMQFQIGPKSGQDGETMMAPIVVPIHGLRVPSVGRYCFDLWWRGARLSSCHFNASLRDAPAPS